VAKSTEETTGEHGGLEKDLTEAQREKREAVSRAGDGRRVGGAEGGVDR